MQPKSVLTRFHNCLILRDGKIIREDLWVRDGKIANPEQVFYVEQLEADVTVNCKGFLIAPGFIDIQINGGMGVDFSYDTENIEKGINIVAKELITHGVTSFCPTMVTSDVEKYRKILPKIKKAQGGKHGATVLGVHLEGPFISLAKKGAHMEKYIKVPEKGGTIGGLIAKSDLFQATFGWIGSVRIEADGGGLESIKEVYGSLENVVIVTLAPELKGALEAIRGLSELGIKVALGHSTASLAEGEKAIENGANLITHLFNAMLPFHHRDPGLVGLLASNTKKQVYYGIISDGIHTHPAALRIASRTNMDGLVLVSDAVAAQGLADGNHRIGPQAVCVVAGKAYVAGTDTLCGSTTALDECVITLKKSLDCSLEYALQAASLHPARALGIDDRKGKLDFGYDADFVFLHPETLNVQSTWIAGECVVSHGLL